MNIVRKAVSLLTPRERKSGGAVFLLVVLKGIGDMIGVAAIIPFLSVLSNPEVVETNPTAARLYGALGLQSVDAFLVALGFAVIAVLVLNGLLRAIATYAMNRWTAMREYGLSKRLIETYLRQPYEFFLGRNSGDMAAKILAETGNMVSGFYRPAAEIVSASVSLLLIAGLLVWTDPVVALIALLGIGAAYFLLYMSQRTRMQSMGARVVTANRARYRIAGEALAGVKAIKLVGREAGYLSSFAAPSERWARLRAVNMTLRQVPRFGLEVLAFGGIIVMTLSLIARSGGVDGNALASTLPVLGVFAFGALRLMPVMQTLYISVATIRFSAASVDTVYDDLSRRDALARLPSAPPRPMGLHREIRVDGVSYTYSGSENAGLRDVSFTVPRGATIGIVGPTGAGKTTLVDLLLGLLWPASGRIVVDGVPLSEDRIREWQATIGYVPQDIFLSDASVAQNIAMGIPAEDISMEQVEAAARLAQIHEHITSEMPRGYDTVIGDRGVRLSGGQRQRIGIARALYSDPDVIVFDEATSALDTRTEADLIRDISSLSGSKTIFMIAHRLSTVEGCDRILVLEQGRLVGADTFDGLRKGNDHFARLMAKPEPALEGLRHDSA